ncbi:phospholipase A [Arenicella xantha]|uniref:Phospholipase A1 n=1 Tax=Arenicella xantha TaxID=644221 RepID=A0A395JMB3_9GAMM|nr:phospholipase A [Arenicella xantha]RBP52781.1 phospholipase A1 [Arenicella xantha]
MSIKTTVANRTIFPSILTLLIVCTNSNLAFGDSSKPEISKAARVDQCVATRVLSANADTTVSTLFAECNQHVSAASDAVDTTTEERQVSEQSIARNRFTLLQHRPNYLLPVAYNFDAENTELIGPDGEQRAIDPTEFKFQISFKTLLWQDLLDTRANLYASYTNTSWWQAYNRDESSPFRETNHQPELFVDIPSDFSYAGWELANVRLGLSHQSNGRSGEFSRTWNRAFAELAFSNANNEIRIRPWSSLSNIKDNPDIEEFRGRFELAGTHQLGNHTLEWAGRHTLDNNNRGSIQLGWSFPVAGREDLQFFLQYFDGYGESLIDYDVKSRRLGLGFKLGG